MDIKELKANIADILDEELKSSKVMTNLHFISGRIMREFEKAETNAIYAEKRMDGWLGRIVRSNYSLAIVASAFLSTITITALIAYTLCEVL